MKLGGLFQGLRMDVPFKRFKAVRKTRRFSGEPSRESASERFPSVSTQPSGATERQNVGRRLSNLELELKVFLGSSLEQFLRPSAKLERVC